MILRYGRISETKHIKGKKEGEREAERERERCGDKKKTHKGKD